MSNSFRPSWDHVWMNVAYTIAQRSVDPQLKVGAVIVTEDNTQVLALGYNGDEKGGTNQRESEEPGHSGFLHAELNACIKLDYNNPKKKILYCTHSMCRQCAKILINAGISKVVYSEEYRDLTGLDILQKSGIVVEKITT